MYSMFKTINYYYYYSDISQRLPINVDIDIDIYQRLPIDMDVDIFQNCLIDSDIDISNRATTTANRFMTLGWDNLCEC